jgi:hypothetical protein
MISSLSDIAKALSAENFALRLTHFGVERSVRRKIGARLPVSLFPRGVFVKQRIEDPGRALSRDEAPGLWTLAAEVAAAIGTRPVDEIRITPGTEVAVMNGGLTRRSPTTPRSAF